MHFGFLFYSFYSVLGKYASKFEFLSKYYCIIYILLIFILFIYALIWQQVLKYINLSIATANKACTIIWGMIWSFLFFNESITLKKIIGASLIFAGIIFLSKSNNIGDKNEK